MKSSFSLKPLFSFIAITIVNVGMPTVALAVRTTAINGTAIGTATGTLDGWVIAGGCNFFGVNAKAAFDGGPFIGPVGALGTKPSDGTATATTAAIIGPPPGPPGRIPFGQGTATLTGECGFFTYEYDYTLSAIAQAGVPTLAKPIRTTTTIAELIDPIPLEIGNVDEPFTNSMLLGSGTQLEGLVEGEEAFKLVLEGRFGEGVFTLPEFWPEDGSLPPETFKLYEVEVFENMLGEVEAFVQLFSSPNPDFEIVFNSTATEIETLIESASWVERSGGGFTLTENLSLFDLDLINLNASNFGEPGALGFRAEISSFESAVPEPSTGGSLALGGFVSLLACGWRKRKRGT